ncbi:MAG TPA: amidohydrolase family protein [Solirubrobacteraceae bacterium]|jgi:cytosine/adenosine deaminase-related metal-dependent hydrolase|nr:amidohydrolase family protein [Solirubrobacteraceae bacterium]
MTTRLLIRGGTIVSFDARTQTPLAGDVLIENGTIAAIAPLIEAADAELIEAEGAVVMPGLVDAHRHLWYETVRGLAMDCSLGALRRDIWGRLAVRFTPLDVHLATRAAIVDALSHGITTVFDWCHIINTPEHGEEAIRAHLELPIRSVFGYGTSMTRKLEELDGLHAGGGQLERMPEAVLRPTTARTSFALALQGPEATSLATTRREIAAARAVGLPVSMHVGIRDAARPRRAIARLLGAGLMGPDLQFVHCCTSSARELRAVADAGARIAVCPMAEMALGIGVPPTGRARAAGLRPALATDAVSSASGDLFDEARLALAGERISSPAGAQESRPSAREALAGITLDAARACWLENLTGSLEVGKRADVVLLRGLDIAAIPGADLHGAIIASAHGANVDTVLVDGEIIKRDGALVGIDRAATAAALAESRARLIAEAGSEAIR